VGHAVNVVEIEKGSQPGGLQS